MLWYDVRRSLLSRRMLLTLLFALFCLYQPTFYILRSESRWIWENGLIGSLQDAYGLGVYLFCAPATAAICASALYVKDRRSGVFPYYVARVGRVRYLLSKVLCCGLSGSVALVFPVLLFSFLQFALYAGWKCAPGDWPAILLDVATLASFGFVWSLVGLALSAWTDSVQVAYASPYAIVMMLKTFPFPREINKWIDPSLQISPLNGTQINWTVNLITQGGAILLCIALLYLGVRRCAE